MLSRLLEYGWAAAFKGAAAVCGLLLSLVLTRTVGASVSGYFFLFFSVLSVLSVVTRLGSDNLVLRFVPHVFAERRLDEVNLYYRYAMLSMITLSVLSSGLLIAAEEAFVAMLSLGPDADILPRMVAITIPAYGAILVNSFFYLALGRATTSIALPGVALPIVFTLALWLSANCGVRPLSWSGSLQNVLWLYMGAVYSVALLSTITLLRRRKGALLNKTDSELTIARCRQLIGNSLPFFAVAVVNVIAINIGNLSGGIFLEPREISFLAVSTKIATSIALILTAVNAVVAPRFSRLHLSGDEEGLIATFREARNVTLVVGIVPFAFIALFSRPILSLFGPEFISASTVLIIVSVGQFINAATGPVTYLLQMAGQERAFMRLTFAVSVISIIGTFLMTSIFGLLGAAFAVAGSAAVLNITSLIVVKRRLGFSWI